MSVNKGNKVNTARLQKKCTKDAKNAIEIFQQNPQFVRPKYVALAANQVGIGYERESEWLEAALSYQKAMLPLEEKFGRENPAVMDVVGRWIKARARLEFGDDLAKAKAANLCDCWPYDRGDSKVRLVKGAKMDLPTRVLTIRSSGVVVLEADVSDAGETQDIRVLYSWPQGQYDKEAIAAFKQFKYAAKESDENADARKDIVQTFSPIVYNEDSNQTY